MTSLKINEYTHKNANDPYMPSTFIECPTQTTLDDYQPVKWEKNKPKFDRDTEVAYLYHVRGYRWYNDKWYQLTSSGKYIECRPIDVKSDCRAHINRHSHGVDMLKKTMMGDVIDQLQAYATSTIYEEWQHFLESEDGWKYDRRPDEAPLIHVRNGYINPDTGELLPDCGCKLDDESLKWYNVDYIPMSFDELTDMAIPFEELGIKIAPEDIAKINTFEKAYSIVFYKPNRGATDEDECNFYYGFMSSLLFDERTPVAMFLQGEAGTGKSALMKAPEKILGDAVSYVELFTLLATFGLQQIRGKRLNITNEVSIIGGEVENKLKSLIDGDKQTYRIKHHGEAHEPSPTRFVMTCNQLPEGFDLSDSGKKRRYAVIYCENESIKQEWDLWKIFESDIGLSWYFSRLFHVWKHNRDNGIRLTDLITDRMMKNIQSLESDAPINQWLLDICGTFDRKNELKTIQTAIHDLGYTTEVFDNYRQFCQDNGLEHVKSGQRFSRMIKEMFKVELGDEVKIYTVDGKRVSKYRYVPRV